MKMPENVAENSLDAIDARIDAFIGTLKPGPSKRMITEVYRPFCKAMVKMHRVDDVDEVVHAAGVLVANIVRETAMSCSRDPKRMKLAILIHAKRLIKNE